MTRTEGGAGIWSLPIVRWPLVLLLTTFLAGFVYYCAYHPIDFVQYPDTVQAMLSGHHELYGPVTSMVWPLSYRSSPLLPLLFYPLALLPFHLAAGIWAALKFVALYFVLRITNRMCQEAYGRRLPSSYGWVVFLISASYLVQEFRSGNAQFFVFALTVAGLYFLDSRPILAASAFALGTNLKLVPGFFIPYLWVRGYRKMTFWFAGFLALFLLLPAFYFGFSWNLHLLRNWWTTGLLGASAERWEMNPDPSFRGLMTRYLSAVPYQTHADPNYRNINFANVSPQTLHLAWMLVVVVAYVALLLLARSLRRAVVSHPKRVDLLGYALLFCAQLLLAPITQRIYLVALLFPAMVFAYELAGLKSEILWRRLIQCLGLLTILFFALPPLIPGRADQRLFAVYGVDCWGMVFFCVCLILLLRARVRSLEFE